MLGRFLGFWLAASTTTVAAQGPPDAIARCFGRDDCARCLKVLLGESKNGIQHLQVAKSCKRPDRALGFTEAYDGTVSVYAAASAMTTAQQVIEMVVDLRSSGWAGGSSSTVLTSLLDQALKAPGSGAVDARIAGITRAVETTTGNLKASSAAAETVNQIRDAELPALFQGALDQAKTDLVPINTALDQLAALPTPGKPVSAPLSSGVVRQSQIRQDIRDAVPPAHRRASGPDLGGAFGRPIESPAGARGISGEVTRERAKLAAASATMAPERVLELDAQLALADRYAAAGDKGRQIAERLLGDAQSARQAAEGKSIFREETRVAPDGALTVVQAAADDPVAADSLGRIALRTELRVQFGSMRVAEARRAVTATPGPDAADREQAVSFAEQFLREAHARFIDGDYVSADAFVSGGLMLADVASGLTPWVSVPRALYELGTGRDVLTGQELTDFEMAARVTDVATVGFAGSFRKAEGVIAHIAKQRGPSIDKIMQSAERYAARMEKFGLKPQIPLDRVKHIREAHLPGGVDVGASKYGTVFAKDTDVLEVAANAWEFGEIVPAALVKEGVESRLWRRGPDAAPIGYTVHDIPPRTATDVIVRFDSKTGELATVFPRHPDFTTLPDP